MKTIHIVMGRGDYDETDWVVKAFESRSGADAFALKCEQHARACPDLVKRLNDGEDLTGDEVEEAHIVKDCWRRSGPDVVGFFEAETRYVVREVPFVGKGEA